MGENTKIEWAHHTFNPWIGCTKVSPACDHCYAETLATARLGVAWGPHAERRRTKPSTWNLPLRWNRQAEREGVRYRVFCASLADVFDNKVDEDWRVDLWGLIAATPHLDWLLLTKRPQNIAKMLPATRGFYHPAWGNGWPNVWLGTTVENQAEADRRIPHLLAVPAAKRFLSCEPMLGPVDLQRVDMPPFDAVGNVLTGMWKWNGGPIRRETPRIDWVIAGGESGPDARPSHPDWFRSLRDQCQAAGVPFLFKQWGEWRAADETELPARFGDPACAEFRCISSCGFVGDMSVGSAFLHKPRTHPQCFPDGGSGDATCCATFVRRVGKKAAGKLLDGREWLETPT